MDVILALFACYIPFALLHSTTASTGSHLGWRLAWMPLVAFIFLLSATRVGGSDWQNYEDLYLYMSHADDWLDAILKNPFFEPGYVALNYAFHLLSEDRRWLVVFESVINSYAIWLILTRVKGGVILLIWLFPLQFANILGVRQTFATSIFIMAVTVLHGRASVVVSLSSGLIHMSSFLLIFGHVMQKLRMTWRAVVLSFISVIIFIFLAGEFLSDKLANYKENSADLTGISGLEIVFGKGLTVFFLFGIDAFSRRQSQHIEGLATGRSSPPTGLYLLYLAVIAISSALPPLARLLTPLELLIAWAVCEAIAGIRNQITRVSLTFLIATVSMIKMFKIWAQFGDIYSVCFLCE
jgi:hypothetical protein